MTPRSTSARVPGWRRPARTLLGLLLCAVTTAGCATPMSEVIPPGPLPILLVNDEGPNAVGTMVLRDSLLRAGHRVTTVTPMSRREDDGTKTTMTGDLVVRGSDGDSRIWSVNGTPADATLVGLRSILASDWPNLVIAGINSRPTVGVSAIQSGSVGAAMTAANYSIGAMAVSTEVADPARPRPEQFVPTADFVVRMIRTLQEQRTSILLMPARTVLNVNYPGGGQRAEKVTVAPVAPTPETSMFYVPGSRPGTLTPAPSRRDPFVGENDAIALRGGDVVLTDLSSDPDRSAPPPRVAARLAPAMKP